MEKRTVLILRFTKLKGMLKIRKQKLETSFFMKKLLRNAKTSEKQKCSNGKK